MDACKLMKVPKANIALLADDDETRNRPLGEATSGWWSVPGLANWSRPPHLSDQDTGG
jgi:hypothetical protein